MRTTCVVLLSLGTLIASPSVAAAEAVHNAAEATRALSRYDGDASTRRASTVEALRVLGDTGGREELALLRSFSREPEPEIAGSARAALATVRQRILEQARAQFRSSWHPPTGDDAAYAAGLLLQTPDAVDGVRSRKEVVNLLQSGYPRRALAALGDAATPADLRLEAIAREEMGDFEGALHCYARLALSGESAAPGALRALGVDPDRLLSGWQEQSPHPEESPATALAVDALKR